MAKLEILTQFNKLFNKVKESLDNYNDNLRNELFEIQPNEENKKAYQRGETIFDQFDESLNCINLILK